MSAAAQTSVTAFWMWLAANRTAFAVLVGVIWTGVMFLCVRDATVSVICGTAFGAVSLFTLPRAPRS
ncbi:hypothetical protein [Streptomyces sp. ISL-100]|uniref:hypothetical protein n=1 Tax=Streptomyces sp. ISL-100 TaxID=2819173 RepID=UPI001BE892F2|nr:hypothetical protein [Streptomyces sp. ISL-100]MBT2399793.1 hypothetical protein [Streptomyces sp. ISL-100]